MTLHGLITMHNCILQCFIANWHPQSTVFQSKYNHFNYICHLALKTEQSYLSSMLNTLSKKMQAYIFSFVLSVNLREKKRLEWVAQWDEVAYLNEHLIDPYLHKDFDKEEIEIMMSAASLYLLHSSSRRPTMKEVKVPAYCYKFSSLCQ